MVVLEIWKKAAVVRLKVTNLNPKTFSESPDGIELSAHPSDHQPLNCQVQGFLKDGGRRVWPAAKLDPAHTRNLAKTRPNAAGGISFSSKILTFNPPKPQKTPLFEDF